MTVGTIECPGFSFTSLVLKQLIFIYFSQKCVILDQTYSFTKNVDTRLYNSVSWICMRPSHCDTGARGTWQPMIITYFASTSPLKFSWHSSFNLARSTCSFYWWYIFCFEYPWIWISIINTEGKNHVIL